MELPGVQAINKISLLSLFDLEGPKTSRTWFLAVFGPALRLNVFAFWKIPS
jgi:hypothetical protein